MYVQEEHKPTCICSDSNPKRAAEGGSDPLWRDATKAATSSIRLYYESFRLIALLLSVMRVLEKQTLCNDLHPGADR